MSTAVSRRQAETTPVIVPNTIANSVPSAIIGSVFLSGSQSSLLTGLLSSERLAQVAVEEARDVEAVLLSDWTCPGPSSWRWISLNSGLHWRQRRASTASPGIARKRTKLSVIATNTVTIAKKIRLMT